MSFKWLRLYGAVLLAVLLAHGMALGGKFHFDDTHTISLNPAVQSLSNLPKIWTDISSFSAIPENRIFRPMTFTVFSLLWALGSGAPWVFIAFKILAHAGVALLLGLIWLEIFARAFPQYPERERRLTAAAMSLLFAIHPACAEVVNYISSTTSLLAALFYLGAFLAFLRGKTWVSLALFAGSVMSKEEGITLVATIFVFTWLFERSVRVSVRKTLPWMLAAVVFAGVVFSMMPKSLNESRGGIHPMIYFMTQWRAYLHYLGMSFVPLGLNADNTSFGFSSGFLELRVLLAFVGNLTLLALAWASRRRCAPLTFGVLWFYIALAPASSIVPLAEPVNEHRMYLGYVGWFGAVGSMVLFLMNEALRVRPPRAWLATGASVVVLMFCALSQARAHVWNSPERLWADTVAKNPDNGRAYNNLALIYIGQAQYEKALPLLSRCGEVWPNYAYCAINRGIALGELGRLDEAEANFKRAIDLGMAQVYTNFYYGRFLEEKRQNPSLAVKYYDVSMRLSNGSFQDAAQRLTRLKKLGF